MLLTQLVVTYKQKHDIGCMYLKSFTDVLLDWVTAISVLNTAVKLTAASSLGTEQC